MNGFNNSASCYFSECLPGRKISHLNSSAEYLPGESDEDYQIRIKRAALKPGAHGFFVVYSANSKNKRPFKLQRVDPKDSLTMTKGDVVEVGRVYGIGSVEMHAAIAAPNTRIYLNGHMSKKDEAIHKKKKKEEERAAKKKAKEDEKR